VINQAGVDPYVFAVIMIYNLCLGLITPPVGTILYLGCGMANIKLGNLIRGMAPFLLAQLAILMAFVLLPQLISAPMRAIAG